MSDRNSIIQRVASLISDTMDGDTVHLIDSYLPTALRTACKMIAITKPVGHEKLLLKQEIDSDTYVILDSADEYRKFVLTSFTYPFVITDKFHLMRLKEEVSDEYYRCYPVGSYESLRLVYTHLVNYYFIEENNVFIASTVDTLGTEGTISGVEVTHYIYATIDQYPEELEDILISELVKLLPMEMNKQAVEKSNV